MNLKTLKLQIGIATLAGPAALSLAIFFATATPVQAGGTDILHFTVTKVMTNNVVEPDADGVVMASQKKHGKADNQKLSIMVTGLAPSTAYELVATIDSDTNMVDVGPFTTNDKGDARLDFAGLGHGHGGGKHASALPAGLDPVSLIREVNIVSSNAEPVLTADLSAPDKLQYLIKRNVKNGEVKGTLQIHATTSQMQFRLSATGLAANTDYLLAFNDAVVQTNTADPKGRLSIHTLAETPPDILDVRSVTLLDASSNIVLQATLP